MSEGAVQAGVKVVAAANHWQMAVSSHELNHPEAKHHCQDLTLMDPRDFPAYDLLLAGPACPGHTPARGKEKPHHDASRATAWCVVDVVEATRPKALMVENVPGFMKWALYPLWKQALETLGYKVTTQVMDAAEYGVPQNRERLFVVGSLKKSIELVSPGLAPVPASSFLRFDNSVKWSPIAKPGRAQATLDRIERGRRELGVERFLAPFYGNGSGLTGRSINRPIGTVTTLDRYVVVNGDQLRCLTVDEYKAAQSFPAAYQLLGTRRDQIMQLGNAVPPPMAREHCRQIMAAM